MTSRMEKMKTLETGGLLFLALLGCGHDGPKVLPVQGKIEVPNADVKDLAGSHVELALTSDNSKRSSGIIQENGTFRVETLHGATILQGAREGKHQARIILSDDDPASRRRAAKSIGKKYLSFETSGWTIDVPSNGEVTLRAATN